MTYLVTPTNGDEILEVTGQYIPKDKTNPEISSGYMHYFIVDGKYVKFSAFHYNVKQVD